MTKFLLFALPCVAVLFFSSCDDILFEQPQPSWVKKNEKTFPEEIKGIYCGHEKQDTIRINAGSIAPLHPKPKDEIFALSDSIILRVDNGNYYLNFKSDEFWDVTLARLNGDSLITYNLSSKDEAVRNETGRITPFKEMKGDSGKYVIRPSPDEFRKIVGSNLFRQQDVYLRIKQKK